MAEKTGNTVKLAYDFNTSGVCEVCIKGNWYRTTAREFRSFDGNRRITEPVPQSATQHMYDYNGPVYVVQTNIQVDRMYSETIITNPNITVTQKSLQNSNRI
jgi:hypothetical protein